VQRPKTVAAAGGRVLEPPFPAARESSGIYGGYQDAVSVVQMPAVNSPFISMFRPLEHAIYVFRLITVFAYRLVTPAPPTSCEAGVAFSKHV
jgi:hypothetical protein